MEGISSDSASLENNVNMYGKKNKWQQQQQQQKQLVRIKLPYEPEIILPSIYPRVQKDVCAPIFTIGLLKIAKICKLFNFPQKDD